MSKSTISPQMTDFNIRPFDFAAAHAIGELTGYMAEALAARLQARGLAARIGYSGQSASTYVDVDFDKTGEETACIRISDHEARSYNRAGDFSISVDGRRHANVSHIVFSKAIYEVAEMQVIEYDEDGDPIEWGDTVYRETENGDEDDAELIGYRFDADDVSAAIAAAIAFCERRHAA